MHGSLIRKLLFVYVIHRYSQSVLKKPDLWNSQYTVLFLSNCHCTRYEDGRPLTLVWFLCKNLNLGYFLHQSMSISTWFHAFSLTMVIKHMLWIWLYRYKQLSFNLCLAIDCILFYLRPILCLSYRSPANFQS